MLIIIIIIANITKITTSNTVPLPREPGVSFGLISCPTILRSLAQAAVKCPLLSTSKGSVIYQKHKCPHMDTIRKPLLRAIAGYEATVSSCHESSPLGERGLKCGGHLVLSCWFIIQCFLVVFVWGAWPVLTMLRKILLCVGECCRAPALTIHRYYQQQLVLRTRQLFFAVALCCLGLAWVLTRGRGLGKAAFSTLFPFSRRRSHWGLGNHFGRGSVETNGVNRQI